VKLVRVFNYAATHGQEVAIRKWLDQFSGYDGGKPLRVGKEIDAISGATISVYAIVADVSEKIMLLRKQSNW
jgi:Na+-translocating ferredoxin:NAD+ oxidoreductase RnfG subunit